MSDGNTFSLTNAIFARNQPSGITSFFPHSYSWTSSPDSLSNSWLRLVQLDPHLDRGLPGIHKKMFSRVNLLKATGESPIE